ncbi:MAG TPA: hypothetical protein VG889_13055 [Rhizomicrobium sp.]|nr:hypothetical protein [Rhizomicrobium sp.]
MSNRGNADIRPEQDPMEQQRSVEYVSTTDARQAVSGLGVRYVLAISLSAALAVMAIIYFIYFPGP